MANKRIEVVGSSVRDYVDGLGERIDCFEQRGVSCEYTYRHSGHSETELPMSRLCEHAMKTVDGVIGVAEYRINPIGQNSGLVYEISGVALVRRATKDSKSSKKKVAVKG